MQYSVAAFDYDGTLAGDGRISEATVAALEACRRSGRKLIMVTGRELPDLLSVCPHLGLFECVVAENGALLYHADGKKEKVLGPAPSAEFVATLKRRGVTPCTTGRVIVSTKHPHETVVLQTIRDLGLELQVIFNKGSVMILPSGINKATGLAAAIKELGLSPENTVAIGDAENDHALLEGCALGVAVANAVPLLKAHADWVTDDENGAGVKQLIDRLLQNDLADLHPKQIADASQTN
ncbi:MAG TPA: HAD family hydrolase [Pirellulales bacterium]|nr:HAD family hydrolase [Pirellulales bacterium]